MTAAVRMIKTNVVSTPNAMEVCGNVNLWDYVATATNPFCPSNEYLWDKHELQLVLSSKRLRINGPEWGRRKTC